MENDLLGNNIKKLLSSPKKKKASGDILNTSIELVKSIDKSMKVLEKVENDTIEVSGANLNKLWRRLTGVEETLYRSDEVFHLTKQNISEFYEEAKEAVLQSDLKLLLDTSIKPANFPEPMKLSDEKKDDASDVSTMNSIANIETEEEYPGTLPIESEIVTTTENDDDLHQMMANQMKVFVDHKKPSLASVETAIKDVSAHVTTINNATFQIRTKSADELNESTSSNGASEMDIEQDSLIQTEPLVSVENSSVDADGFIIPEVNVSFKVTDMDQDDDENQKIEDISFPNLELSMSDEAPQHDNHKNDLSTITECTEYEQSPGSSGDEISSEIVSTSEPLNSEIEKRLISINDSMEEVNEAFKKIAIINRSPSSYTYSTDKDFADSVKASSNEEQSELLVFPASTIDTESQPTTSTPKPEFFVSPPAESESTIETESQTTTSTSKILMPDLISEVSGSKQGDGFN